MSTLWEGLKDPDEVKDYTLNWAPELAVGEVIANQVWTLVAGTDGALNIDDGTLHTDTMSSVWVSGGTAGIDYELTCHITTSSTPHARQLEFTGRIRCRNK